jgi:DNA-directed RNA polymerase specialized sigma24 family protein
MKRSKRVNYLSNANLLADLDEWEAGGREKIPEALGEKFILLTDRILNSANFRGYSAHWKNEWRSTALYALCRYLPNFNREKSTNFFSYASTIIINVCKHGITAEKKRLKTVEDFKLYNNYDIYSTMDGQSYSAVDNQNANYNANNTHYQELKDKPKPKKEKPKKGVENFT